MRISDRFIMALRNLWRRKSRTILTILSVVIGSTSIILMLAFAQGISNSQKEMIGSFQGLTTIDVMDGSGKDNLDINDSIINKLKRVDHVKAVVPSKNLYVDFKIADTEDYSMEGSINVIPDDILSLISQDDLEWGNVPNPSDDDKILLSSNASANKITAMADGMSMEPVDDFDYQAHKYFLRLGWQDESEDDGVNFGNEENNENPDSSNPKEDSNKAESIDVPIELAGKLNKIGRAHV